ncbi:Zinc finger C2H2 [Penicillium mononematosum]|uniref:Zinc finger C2H2 n=1 Tax=Penicillium mononematosum TaxID=268346 RepID=UPI0025472A35|nr:Zinc finger C2H2 [Penicillium mononematosum]KAJ6186582.1 Zinc finger C2H2 [Penicillium mononematosum]
MSTPDDPSELTGSLAFSDFSHELDLLTLFPDAVPENINVTCNHLCFTDSDAQLPSFDEDSVDYAAPHMSGPSVNGQLDETCLAWTGQSNHNADLSTRVETYGGENEQSGTSRGPFSHYSALDRANAPCGMWPPNDVPFSATGKNGYSPSENQQLPFNEIRPNQGNKFNRALPRRRSRYNFERIGDKITPVFIPTNASPADPLTRWQQSPPEDEPASLSAIKDAVQSSYTNNLENGDGTCLDPESAISAHRITNLFETHRRTRSRPASTTSAGSSASASSQQSVKSGLSYGSHSSTQKETSGRVSSRVRKSQGNGRTKRKPAATKPRIFCCTFCCDQFKTKYDWARHEKSLHLNLENWVCAPFGGSVILPSTGRMHCVYCSKLDPSSEHLDEHKHGTCMKSQSRTFKRKDHLVQHLRRFHNVDTIPLIDDWKIGLTDFTSRCGFCDAQITSWDERTDHLALHFRNGLTMADWKGDHGFPPWIAEQVTHSVPPYLIQLESHTLVPFSATNTQVQDHLSQMLSRATFNNETGGHENDGQRHEERPEMTSVIGEFETDNLSLDSYTQVLTRHLSHFAQQQMALGVVPSDEMFQSEARRLLYDSDDPWNQTIADHPQWLATFRASETAD